MSFGLNVRDARCVAGFEQAERVFPTLPIYRGVYWSRYNSTYTRGLANNRQSHYALEKISEDEYSVNLYDQRLIIYKRPVDGTRTCIYNAKRDTAGSWNWLYYHASVRKANRMRTPDDREVMIPVSEYEDTVVVIDDKSKRLIESMSSHPAIYTRASNDEDKRKRAEFKQKVSIITELALHTLCWSGEPKEYFERKRAFSAFDAGVSYAHKNIARAALQEMACGAELDEDISHIIAVANVAYNSYDEQPTPEAFSKAFTAWMVRTARLDTQSGKKLYPQFPDYASVPNKFNFL